MTDRLWPTMSCISRATRVRSVAVASLLRWSRSISSRAARSRRPASWARRMRTTRPSASAAVAVLSRKNSASHTDTAGDARTATSAMAPAMAAQAHGNCRSHPCRARLYRAMNRATSARSAAPRDHWRTNTAVMTANAMRGLRRRHSKGSTSPDWKASIPATGSGVKASRNRRGPSPSSTPLWKRSGRQNIRKTRTTTAVSSTQGCVRSACRNRWPPRDSRATSGPIPLRSSVVTGVTCPWCGCQASVRASR